MLEAAFDGEVGDMEEVLKEVEALDDKNGIPRDEMGTIKRRKHIFDIVECEDANENTPLSEAASGGSKDALQFLFERGANPNSIGAWGRTPLYRAAFAGHYDAVEYLLYCGGDPRIYAQDSNTPEQCASLDPIIELLRNWDIDTTDALLEKLEAKKEERQQELKKKKDMETQLIEDELSE